MPTVEVVYATIVVLCCLLSCSRAWHGSAVYSIATGYPQLRSIGATEHSSAVGQAVGFDTVNSMAWIHPALATARNTFLLGALDLLEVEHTTGKVVRNWVPGASDVTAVATSDTLVAVVRGGRSSLALLDSEGATVRTINLASPANGIHFSADGAVIYTSAGEAYTVASGEQLPGGLPGFVGAPGNDVALCRAGPDSVGAVLSLPSIQKLALFKAGGSPPQYFGTGSSSEALGSFYDPYDVKLVVGLGVLVASSHSWFVQLLSTVAISRHPVSASVAVGASVSFSVSTLGVSSGLTYAWTQDGVPVGSSSPTYTYTGSAADAGISVAVVVTVTHVLGRAVSAPATLTVLPLVRAKRECVEQDCLGP